MSYTTIRYSIEWPKTMCQTHDQIRIPHPRYRRSERHRPIRVAPRLDAQAVRLCRGRPALDLAIGKVLLEMKEGTVLPDLGGAKLLDFAREELGIGEGTCRAMVHLAEGLRERPLLRKAVLSGAVSMGKALAVMEVAVGSDEAAYTVAAMQLTLEKLREIALGARAVPRDEDAVVFETLVFEMTPEQQDRVEKALQVAKELIGYDAPRFRLEEAIALEWLKGHDPEQLPIEDPEPTPDQRAAFEEWDREREKRKDSISRQLDVLMESEELVEHLEEPLPGANAMALRAMAIRLARRRQQFDEPLGRVLFEIEHQRSWRLLGCESFKAYCEERLGIGLSAAAERIRLEGRMRLLPELRKALVSGKLNYSKTLEVARGATRKDVEERIAAAAGTTCQAMREKNRRDAEQSDRSQGVRKLRVSQAVAETITKALTTVKTLFAGEGESLETGEAWARAGDFLVAVWEVPLAKKDWRTRAEKEVMLRHGGLCAAPGCTRAAKHAHHIIFRRHHGPDHPWNLLAVCWCHHKLCIHRGTLTVQGRGGEFLVWTFRDGGLVPREVWETRGDDETRRVDPAT